MEHFEKPTTEDSRTYFSLSHMFRGPRIAWCAAAALQVAVIIQFSCHSSPAPFHEVHGDLYRGWPLIYGTDQGDVVGDGWGPFIYNFQPLNFVIDMLSALIFGMIGSLLILLCGRRFGRHRVPLNDLNEYP